MTPDDFTRIRRDAGLSVNALADIIQVNPRTIRRYEDGSIPISGPVSVLMDMIDRGDIEAGTDGEQGGGR